MATEREPLLRAEELAAMTEQQRGEYYYANRDRLDEIFSEPVEVEPNPDPAAVVSVRFPAGQIGTVEAAANAAGIALSTYIRLAAIGRAQGNDPVAETVRDTLLKSADRLDRDADQIRRLAGAA